MRIGLIAGMIIVAGILTGMLALCSCGSDGGGKGPGEVTAQHVEAGNATELE